MHWQGAKMTYRELLLKGQEALYPIRDSKNDAWLLLENTALDGTSRAVKDRASYYLMQHDRVPDEIREEYFKLIDKRKKHIPLQYITGSQEFMGFNFEVDERVLIPRQDTEVLVESVLPYVKGKSVLDICTGSGCIAVSLLLLGNPRKVTASDKSEAALKLAKKNAERLRADITFIKSDLFDNIEESFDIIVSNPPYISESEMKELEPEVKEHEPSMALWGGMDGLYFYRRIIKEAVNYLKPGGWLFFEIGCSQADLVRRLMEQHGFSNINIVRDYAGLDRVAGGNYGDNESSGGADKPVRRGSERA